MEYKKVETLIDKNWKEIKFSLIKKGSCIRFFEATGELVKDKENRSTFIAISNAFKNDKDLWQVECKAVYE